MSTSTTTVTSNWLPRSVKAKQSAVRSTALLYMPATPPLSSSPASTTTTLSPAATTPPPSPLKKRKSTEPPAQNDTRKRVRSDAAKAKLKKRAQQPDAGSDVDSEAFIEPIYRSSSGSRATSSTSAARKARVCRTDLTFQSGSCTLSSYDAIKPLLRTYKPFFHNPDDPNDYLWKPHPDRPPLAELEYPNSDACEEFMLLEPKDKDHYNPIFDLETSLYNIIRHYLTPKQQRLFGTLPRTDFHFDHDHDHNPPLSPPPSPSKKPPSPLHRFRKAIATRNGPLFTSALREMNRLIRGLKYPSLPSDLFQNVQPNSLMTAVSSWSQIPKDVVLQILEENYQRSVGPHVNKLKQYEAFSNEVYGELMPSLMYQIVENSNLDENSLFLDLGSGVGNLVVQASLQTGCRSYGIELQEPASRVAEKMVQHFRTRCTMWGLKCGEIEVERGSMLESARVDELIKRADLVLVDNKMFDGFLNESLKPKFLDLKEGAIVISLKPFSDVNARVTDRNLDDMAAIFEVEERSYRSGDVSWGNRPGSYFVHTVNRDSYAHTRSRFEESRSITTRRSRSAR